MENYVKIQSKSVATILIKTFKAFQQVIHRIHKDLRHPYVNPNSNYEHLICITGFGNSGSGTVIDYLSEFNNTTVFGGYDLDSGGPESKASYSKSIEIDFLRKSMGVYALEGIVGSKNHFYNHMLITLFITNSEYNYRGGGFYNDKYMEETRKFIENITDYKTESEYCGREFTPDLSFFSYSYGDYKNLESPLIANFANPHYLYFTKNLTRSEFRKYAAEYIHNLLLGVESKPYLVLDQFISDGNPNLETHMEYCGNLYEIAVYRDPRDVYVSGIIGNEAWIPHNPVDFVKWYRQRVEQYVETPHQNRLLIRFEDMVMDYKHTTDKIQSFLRLSTDAHVKKHGYFDPALSSKNIGIYQSFDDQLSIQIIEQELQKYCYNL